MNTFPKSSIVRYWGIGPTQAGMAHPDSLHFEDYAEGWIYCTVEEDCGTFVRVWRQFEKPGDGDLDGCVRIEKQRLEFLPNA